MKILLEPKISLKMFLLRTARQKPQGWQGPTGPIPNLCQGQQEAV